MARVVNTILDMNRRFGVNRNDRILGLASFGFDLSVYDLFGMLAVGGTIVLPEERLAQQPAHWADLLERHQITVWSSVPTSLEMLISYAGRAELHRAADELAAGARRGRLDFAFAAPAASRSSIATLRSSV